MSAAGLVGLVEVHPELIDPSGWRVAVPPEGFAQGDPDQAFRLQVLASSATEQVLAEIRWAYLQSKEIRTLYKTFDLTEEVNLPVQRALRLQITSSRKYTKFRFPNCPQLKAAIHWILVRHKCQAVGRDHLLDLECEIAVPALGRINETHDFITD